MPKLTANKPATGALDDPQGIELATMKERQRKIDAYPQLVEALREIRERDSSVFDAIKQTSMGPCAKIADVALRQLGEA